jgi:ABC-type Zn uptake system ZnuABC Zn-binding protein ZnuA
MDAYDIPAIFTEVNGSTATAKAIARETGCGVYSLNMIMSGEGSGIQPYLDAMTANLETLREALK